MPAVDRRNLSEGIRDVMLRAWPPPKAGGVSVGRMRIGADCPLSYCLGLVSGL